MEGEDNYRLVFETGFAAVRCTPEAAEYFRQEYGNFREFGTVATLMAAIRQNPLMGYSVNTAKKQFMVKMRPSDDINFLDDSLDVFEKHYSPVSRLTAHEVLGSIAEDPYFIVSQHGNEIRVKLSATYHEREMVKPVVTLEGIDKLLIPRQKKTAGARKTA